MSFSQMSSNLLTAIPVVVNPSWAETEVFEICLVIYSVCVCVCVCACVCVCVCVCVRVCVCTHVQLFAAPWTVAHHTTFYSSAKGIFQARILPYLF